MTVYLVPARQGRYELYSEAAETPEAQTTPDGRIRRWLHSANEQWQALVAQARRRDGVGRFARWRDRIVCALAESIAEQRTLWALRGIDRATLHIPVTLDPADARQRLMHDLAHARRHHLRWLIVDTIFMVLSAALAIVPGPNVLAYYFIFRCVGHLQSWRGARQGMDRMTWTFTRDAALTELQALVDVPRSARSSQVKAIAERLELRHLADFFDRVAIPSA